LPAWRAPAGLRAARRGRPRGGLLRVVRGDRRGDLVGLEAAVLQEPHLPGPGREIGGQGRAETALAHAAGKRPPVLAAVPERPLRDPALQAALLELEADPHRALALADTGPDQAFGEAGVVLEAFRREPLHRLAGGLRL